MSQNVLVAQNTFSSDEALQRFNDIGENLICSFPEHELYVSRRSAFTEKELAIYLTQYFERLSLLDQIDKNYSLKLSTYIDTGSWFRRMGMFKESNNVLLKFFEEYKHCRHLLSKEENEPYFNLSIYVRGALAGNYTKLGVLDSAEIHHKINVDFTKSEKTIFYPSSLNNYGMFLYTEKKDFEGALFLFEKAYVICQDQFKDHSLLGSIRDNMADIYVDQSEFKKASKYYEQNFDFYRRVRNEKENEYDIPRLISAAAQAINVNIILHENKRAINIFNQLYSFLKLQNIKTSKLVPDDRLELLLLNAQIFKIRKNQDLAYDVAIKAKDLSDSIYFEKEKTNAMWNNVLANISINRIKERSRWEQLGKENELAKQKLKLWLTILISILIIGFFVVLVWRHRMKSKQAKDKQLLAEQKLLLTSEKNARLKAEVNSKKRDVSDLALNLSSQYNWAQLIYERFEEIKAAKVNNRAGLMDQLELELKNKIDYDEETKVFFQKVDALSDSFYREIKNRFPNLSKTELRLCSMIRLKIDSQQIANLQNIAVTSVNKSRYRIRKKMDLDETVSLDEFIQNL